MKEFTLTNIFLVAGGLVARVSLQGLMFPVDGFVQLKTATTSQFHSTTSFDGFVQLKTATTSQFHSTTSLHSTKDVEKYRANLENLMQQQQDLENQSAEQEGLLTTTGRHRRLLEIELMKSLRKSEDAVNELMHLWMYENDASMAQELEEMQDECSSGMVYEENRLREMIEEFPTWAEPRARLALLLFFQGKTQDSYKMALDTLVLKPWHFEIYPLLVLLSLRQQQFGQALSWARRALPPFRENGKNKRRNEWIRIAVELAENQLFQAEQRTRRTEGACLPSPREGLNDNDNLEDAWQ